MPNTLAIVQFYCTYKGVGNKCKKTDDQTDTIVINNNERKDLAF
jgi:hypothetical protein